MEEYDNTNNENEKIFKSFLRSLLRQLKTIDKAIDNGDTAEAKGLIAELIEDTQKNIEN